MPKKNANKSEQKSHESRSRSRSASDSRSHSSDSADDMPSGFTSDSYSDDGSVYTELSWPSWKLLVAALGLPSIQWVGPVGIVRIQRLFGTVQFEPLRVSINIVDGPSLSISYQDIIDCQTPVSIDRREDKIHFVGSVGQFRTFRRNIHRLLIDSLVPMASRIPYDSQANLMQMMGMFSDDEDDEEGQQDKRDDKASAASPLAYRSESPVLLNRQ